MRHNLLFCLMLPAAATLAAQTPRVIEGGPSCARCDIVVEKVVRFDDPAADIDAGISNLSSIERDSQGRWWVVTGAARRTSVLVFDKQGKLIKKVGRKGAGPGEFEHVSSAVIGTGDSVRAFDNGQMRVSVISPTTLEIVRTFSWPAMTFGPLLMQDGTTIISSSTIGKGYGYLLHRINGKGEVVASFDSNTYSSDRQMREWVGQRIARGNANDIFTVPQSSGYTLERWSADGKQLGAWQRKVDWFPPFQRPTKYDARIGFPPDLFAIWVDSAGLVYVAGHALQPGFARATRETKSEMGMVFTVDDPNKYWDTVIEVFDPATSTLVASKRIDTHFEWQAGPGHLYLKGDDPQDFIDVYRVRLVRK